MNRLSVSKVQWSKRRNFRASATHPQVGCRTSPLRRSRYSTP